jgi:F0F1-type ATP synthase assembly protein I
MSKASQPVEKTKSPSGVFVAMALDMSWRLAVTVLVPIIGGVELDKALNTSPWLMILGFILAIAGMALVMRQTVQTANQVTLPPNKEKRS